MQKEIMRLRIEELELKVENYTTLLRALDTFITEHNTDMCFLEEQIKKALGE